MTSGSCICFDVIMTATVVLFGGAIPWFTYRGYKAMAAKLQDGEASEVARKSLRSMTSIAMTTLAVGVTLGVGIASIASTESASSASKWMAAAAMLWVLGCSLAVSLRLDLKTPPLKDVPASPGRT